ncbi:LysR family transcriptional regulator [Dyella japonica]|uniref:LysR family transcriptional regulator n=1 Tax=Dyella japonica DSM 16301 TaxID=1440762 RepID=A0A0G9H6M2_9GAMM|nr:LysR family transcriptional regulator [Dyella japonica]KLD65208.1 LysR family transcriptional regulator [Dyella japonica DSM 16301]
MPRENYNDLTAFLAVAREGSFTKAAAQLGVTQSALSHGIRGLEARLGIRLFHRTTRSVSTTEAGERLRERLAPQFEEIDHALEALGDLRDRPSGTVRITCGAHGIDTVLWPRLSKLLANYPDIRIELIADSRLRDIVAERFDAGVRLGEQIAKDMVAVRIGPDMRMAAVASPGYLSQRKAIRTPKDLADHRCINLRFLTHGGLYAWEFEKRGREVRVHVDGQLVFNETRHALRAALDGFGLAYMPEDLVLNDIAKGRLVRVLEDWCPPFPGYHLYYPSRRRASQAFQLVVDALRYR